MEEGYYPISDYDILRGTLTKHYKRMIYKGIPLKVAKAFVQGVGMDLGRRFIRTTSSYIYGNQQKPQRVYNKIYYPYRKNRGMFLPYRKSYRKPYRKRTYRKRNYRKKNYKKYWY